MSGLRYAALGLAVVLAILAMAWPAAPTSDIRKQRRRALASYGLSLALGVLILVLVPLGHGETVPFFGTLALVAWAMLGGLWLSRRYPGLEQPDWVLQRWSPADWGLIAVLILSCLATMLG